MSYEQAKNNADKWNKALIKKGVNIKEAEDDVEIIKDFGDGFKIIKLIGKSAYEREGNLMRHCVASYWGKEKEIYSLRDKDNMPHATLEKDQQIKGKGNGSISPKYIHYIVEFLKEIGMSVGDAEMKNLGYVNVGRIKNKLDAKKNKFYGEYLYCQDEWFSSDGEEYRELDILQFKPLVSKIGIEADIKIQFNFNISALLQKAFIKIKSITDSTRGHTSTAVANESYSTAVANAENSVAFGRGKNNKAKGVIGAWLILTELNKNNEIVEIISGKVDGGNLKADTFYKIEKGKFVEVDIKNNNELKND